MPGLFGILSKTDRHDRDALLRLGQRMAASMQHRPWLRTTLWGDDAFCGGRVHLSATSTEDQRNRADFAKRVWVDGELWVNGASRPATDPSLLTEVLETTDTIAAADGLFTVAAYHPEGRRLTIATDRLGMRPLYWRETPQWFAFAGEVKALLAIADGLPELDEIGLCQFFGFDHMFGDRTWWKGIQLVPPASLWRLSPRARTLDQYWKLADVQQDLMDAPALARELSRHWTQAVARDSRPGVTPLLLSGGQDSRLLLAELRAQGRDVVTVTFGRPQAPDMQIAKLCAQTAGVEHRPCYLGPDNWWKGRNDAIWQTDGLVNAHHLHAAAAAENIHTGNLFSPTNFAGDLLFGGTLFAGPVPEDWRTNPIPFLTAAFIENPLVSRERATEAALLDAAPRAVGPSAICFHLSQRVRRLTLTGPFCLASDCEPAFPSLSRPLIDLSLRHMSDALRRHHRFYNWWLVQHYPKYFADIPWQATGRGLAESVHVRMLRSLQARLARVHLLRLPQHRPEDWFVDYAACVRESGVRDRLLAADLLIDEALRGGARQLLRGNRYQEVGCSTTLALLTAETYLRKIAGLPEPLEDDHVAEPRYGRNAVAGTAREAS